MPEEEDFVGFDGEDEGEINEIKKVPRNQSMLSLLTMIEKTGVQAGGTGQVGKSDLLSSGAQLSQLFTCTLMSNFNS